MGKLTLVTGGAKSGKSAFAEAHFSRHQIIGYIATGIMFKDDPEMGLRIKKHQSRRSPKWGTAELNQNIGQFLLTHQYQGYLLDDATMLSTNLFYQLIGEQMSEPITSGSAVDHAIDQLTLDEIDDLQGKILAAWQDIILAASKIEPELVVVTNEVGLGIVPATKQTRLLRDIYGLVNQKLAEAADEVDLVVSGIPVKIKPS